MNANEGFECTMCHALLPSADTKHDYYDCADNMIADHARLLDDWRIYGDLSKLLRYLDGENKKIQAAIPGAAPAGGADCERLMLD